MVAKFGDDGTGVLIMLVAGGGCVIGCGMLGVVTEVRGPLP